MWSYSMTFIGAVGSGITFPIITRTVFTTLLRKTHQRRDLFLASRINLRVWFHSRASVACIIDTTGGRLPEEVSSLMRNLSSSNGSVSDATADTRSCFLPDYCPVLFNTSTSW